MVPHVPYHSKIVSCDPFTFGGSVLDSVFVFTFPVFYIISGI